VQLFAVLSVLALAAQQLPSPAQPTPPPLTESPVQRLDVLPVNRTVVAGDSVQVRVRAMGADGQPIPDAVIAVNMRGGQGEGIVRPETGWLIASSVGKFPLVITATVPGSRPFIDMTYEFHGVPGPATRIELSPAVGTIVVGQSLRLQGEPFSAKNDPALDPLVWRSSAPNVLAVDAATGLVRGVAPGTARLAASAGSATTTVDVRVVADNLTALSIAPAASSVRQGDVLRLTVAARAGNQNVTGLTPTWSFSPGDGRMEGDGRFVAYRPGAYTVTAVVGGHAATTTVQVAERDVRRSVSVVGRIPRTLFPTSEVWIHPNGDVAYLGTHGGGDRVYAIDIRDPANPRVVDSIVVNTRLVNDMITTADGNYMVLTREGAADRRNGIVVADIRDPLHPKQIADFTDGVTAGVHSVYLYEHPQLGRYVYLTNDGTGAIDIVSLNDPANPVRAGEWRTDRPDPARYVHDLDIEDGLMYASYWNDGLVVLDIGNGRWGGRPDRPVLVSQYKYDLDALYREVEDVSGPGFTRGTHTAWRQRGGGRYVFIADEVYLNSPIEGAKDAAADRMYGTLQVIDVSDITEPRAVAWYTPEHGGVHNVWVEGDTLYMGAYNGGFRAFDISGELMGDLRAQGREIAALNTADMDGVVANAAFTWGVVVNKKDGLAYVNDFNNGLWVVRINPKSRPLLP
jgi:hypothetical protein